MELIIALLSLTAVIVVATLLNKRFPGIPLPLFQIGLGAALSWLPLHPELQFEPEAFMICLIAPLLFGDGRAISRRELWEYRKPIYLMALGLVIFTVLGIGRFIHYLIPAMPQAAAFALAAVLSPTDAVAVKSMTKNRAFPKGLMPILEGESLLNDAVGLVSFKLALAVVLTGVFSVRSAIGNFLFVALGGIIVGTVLGFLFVNLRLSLRKRGLEEINSLVAIQLITPFVIYIAAEKLSVSGVLAVVAAGIIHGIERDRLQQTATKLQIISANTWSVLSYVLNGFVFVLLGFLLPDVLNGLLDSGEPPLGQALGLAFFIALALLAARCIWVYVLYDRFVPHEREARSGKRTAPVRAPAPVRVRYAFTAAICGIHGTIALATALSIPFALPGGTSFPLRNAMLFLAAAVILISIVIAALVLPLLGRQAGREGEDGQCLTAREASDYIARKSMQVLVAEMRPENREATGVVIRNLEEQIRAQKHGNVKLSEPAIREFQQIGRDAQAAKLAELGRLGRISPQLQAVFPMLAKPHQLFTFRAGVRVGWIKLKLHRLNRRLQRYQHLGYSMHTDHLNKIPALLEELHAVESELQQAAVAAMRERITADNRLEAMFVIQHYNRIAQRKGDSGQSEEAFQEQLKLIQLRSVQIKRDAAQELEDAQQISAETMLALLQAINYDEMLVLDNNRE